MNIHANRSKTPVRAFLVGALALFAMTFSNSARASDAPWDLVEQAAQRHDASVVIPPGTYRVRPGMALKSAQNLEIVADHVTFIFTKLSRGISFDRCTNVTLQGLTIDYDPLPFTQGVVIAAAPDHSWVDVKLDEGYPRRTYERIDVCDPVTHTRKRGMPFLWGTKAAWSGDGILRITLRGIGDIALPGDPVSLSGGPDEGCAPHGVTLDSCNGMTLRDVTLYTAPGMGIIEGDGEGNAKYLHVKIVPGPKPAGAAAERLLSTTWDAMQTKTTRHGPDVEDCEVRDAGDDTWSVQSSDYVILKAEGRQVTIAFRDEYCDGPQPGDRIRTSLDGPEATVVQTQSIARDSVEMSADVGEKLASAKQYSFWKLSDRTAELTIDRDTPFQAGASVYSPDRQCSGFIFRNNKIRSPGRGALIKAGDGLIEGNEFIDCHSGVTVSAEVPDGAAYGIEHLIIRNNHISGTGYFCPLDNSSQAGAISLSGFGDPIRNVTIDSNVFDDINGVNISMIGVSDVTVRGNTFNRPLMSAPQHTGSLLGVDQHSVIWVRQCDRLTLADNLVIQPGPFMNSLVAFGPSVLDTNGLPDGMKPASR